MCVIRAENITKSFEGKQLLKGVSLTARKGEVISILGASGSGKSTFLRCLNLLETPDSGRIFFNGTPLNLQDKRAVCKMRSQIGMVFQNFNLWDNMNVLENIACAPVVVGGVNKEQARAMALEILQQIGMADKVASYPYQLSGGQQQRVAIARTIAMNPQAILFDEPTSALDPEMVAEVLKMIEQLANLGTTMIIVTHEVKFATKISHKVVYFDNGVIQPRDN